MTTPATLCQALVDELAHDARALWLHAGGAPGTTIMIFLMLNGAFVRATFDGSAPRDAREAWLADVLASAAARHEAHDVAISQRHLGTPVFKEVKTVAPSGHAAMGLLQRARDAIEWSGGHDFSAFVDTAETENARTARHRVQNVLEAVGIAGAALGVLVILAGIAIAALQQLTP